MINVYPVKIEAYDDDKELIFKLEAIDECVAKLEVVSCIDYRILDELFLSIREAMYLMKLEGSDVALDTRVDGCELSDRILGECGTERVVAATTDGDDTR
jgi:hypothetical protein